MIFPELALTIALLGDVSLGRYNKNPRMRVQKAENVNKALEFITSRGVKLTNIGPEGEVTLVVLHCCSSQKVAIARHHRWEQEAHPWHDLDSDLAVHHCGYQVC